MTEGTSPFLAIPESQWLAADGLRDRRFDQVDLLVSFVMKSGLDLIRGGLADALDPQRLWHRGWR